MSGKRPNGQNSQNGPARRGGLLRCWLFNVLIGIDQLANALTGGDPDETISSRAGKARRQGRWWGCVLCRLLDRIDARHCAESIEEDEGGRAL